MYGKSWFKILLGLGENQLEYGTYVSGKSNTEFNGTWKPLGHWEFIKTLPTKESPDSNYECLQGMEFYKGVFVCAIGHNGMMGGIYYLTNDGGVERILWDMPQYKDDGTKIGSWENIKSSTEGLCVYNDIVYQGLQSTSPYPYYQGVYKFKIPV